MIFRNESGEALDLPTLGLHVPAGGEVEVTGDPAKGLLESPHFDRVDKPKTRTTDSEES